MICGLLGLYPRIQLSSSFSLQVLKLLIQRGANTKATASHRKFSHLPNSSTLTARDVAKNDGRTRDAFDEVTGEVINLSS